MKNDGTREYSIQAKVDVLAIINVRAKTLAEAVQKAAEIKAEEFVDVIANEHIDTDFRVTGVYEA